MFCKNCGKEIQDGNTFCTNCENGINDITKKEKVVTKNKKHMIIIICIIILAITILSIIKMINNLSNIKESKMFEIIKLIYNNEQDDTITNIAKDVENNKVYTSFNGDIQSTKNVFDGYWQKMISENNITNIKYKEWTTYKQQVYPYFNIATKEFYVYPNKEFAVIGIAYDENQKVVDIKFSGIHPDTLVAQYDLTTRKGYFFIMFSIPQLLKYVTNYDEELSKYLQQILSDSFDNNDWYLNERKQGIKFGIGKNKNNSYLNVEVCLEKYAQD